MKETSFVKRNYKCGFCKGEWSQEVFYDPKGKLSSQVMCPGCLNFMPTWKVRYFDGKKLREDRP